MSDGEATLNYAGPRTHQRRRPLFTVPPRFAKRAAVVSVLLAIPAWWFYHDHMFIRDHNPHSWRWVTPVTICFALPLAGISLLRDRTGRRPALVAGLLAVLLSGAGAVGMFVGPRAIVCGETPYRAMCASNLRQIGQAILIYSMSHAGALPPDLPTLLATTEITAEPFVCPLSQDRPARGRTRAAQVAEMATPGHCSYIYRPQPTLAGAAATDVLAHEPLTAHGGDGVNVLLGTGAVEFWTPKQLAAALAPPSTTQP